MSPSITYPVRQTPPNTLHFCLAQPQVTVYDNSDYCGETLNEDKHTTFNAPKRETESTSPVVYDNDSVIGATDEPVNACVTYQAVNEPGDDDSYEEMTLALYDVPRPVTPMYATCNNSAYNSILTSFDNPVYNNIARRHAV